MPSNKPSLSSITDAEAAGDGKQVITASHVSINTRLFIHVFAPISVNFSTRSAFKSRTYKSTLFLNREPASFPPTFPNPTKPIFIILTL